MKVLFRLCCVGFIGLCFMGGITSCCTAGKSCPYTNNPQESTAFVIPHHQGGERVRIKKLNGVDVDDSSNYLEIACGTVVALVVYENNEVDKDHFLLAQQEVSWEAECGKKYRIDFSLNGNLVEFTVEKLP